MPCQNGRLDRHNSNLAGAYWTVNSATYFRHQAVRKHIKQQSIDGTKWLQTSLKMCCMHKIFHHACMIKVLPNAGEEWASSVSDAEEEKVRGTEERGPSPPPPPPPPIGLQHINWVWMDWRSMAGRPLDSSAVRGIKIWNQLVLCLQTLTSAGRENQLRKLKVEAATRKSFSTRFSAFISAGARAPSGAEDQMVPLSRFLRRDSAPWRNSGEVSDLWTIGLWSEGLPGTPGPPCCSEHTQRHTRAHWDKMKLQLQLTKKAKNP